MGGPELEGKADGRDDGRAKLEGKADGRADGRAKLEVSWLGLCGGTGGG